MRSLLLILFIPILMYSQTASRVTRQDTLRPYLSAGDSIHVKGRMHFYRPSQFDSNVVFNTHIDTAWLKAVSNILPGNDYLDISAAGKTKILTPDTANGGIAIKGQNNRFTARNDFTDRTYFSNASPDTILYTNSLANSTLFVNANQTVDTGSVDSYSFGRLIDAGASFSPYMVGKLVYRLTSANNTDDANYTTRAPESWARITKYISSTQLELSDNLFSSGVSPHYAIDNHTGIATLTTGINTSTTAGKLIDANASFTAGMVGKMVVLYAVADGNEKPNRAIVQTVDSPTQLTLDEDIFTATGHPYAVKTDTTNDFRYIQSAVEGFHAKNGAHYIFLGNGKYREQVVISQQSIGKDDSYSYSKFWTPRFYIVGNPEDNTTVKMIGNTPANDSAYVDNTSVLFLSSGAVASYISGIWGYQADTYMQIQVGASSKIENCNFKNRKIGGQGVQLEQWTLVEIKNCSWTNLFSIAGFGRSGSLVQFQGASNTADSCTNLFDGGDGLAYFHSTSTLTVTGNPVLQSVAADAKRSLILTNAKISGTYSMAPTLSNGTIVDDTLFTKYQTVSTGLRLQSLNALTYPIHQSDAVGFVNGAITQTAADGVTVSSDSLILTGSNSTGEIRERIHNTAAKAIGNRASISYGLTDNTAPNFVQTHNQLSTSDNDTQFELRNPSGSVIVVTTRAGNMVLGTSSTLTSGTGDLGIDDLDADVGTFRGKVSPNGVTTSADGVVSTPDTVVWTAQTASIGAQNFANTATGHLYKATYYLHTTTAGSGGTVLVTFAWNDGAAKTTSSATADLTSTTATGLATGEQVIYVASGTPTWATTVAGAAGSPQYALRITLERLY